VQARRSRQFRLKICSAADIECRLAESSERWHFQLFFSHMCFAFVDSSDRDFSTLFKGKSGLTRVIDVDESCAARRPRRRRHKQRARSRWNLKSQHLIVCFEIRKSAVPVMIREPLAISLLWKIEPTRWISAENQRGRIYSIGKYQDTETATTISPALIWISEKFLHHVKGKVLLFLSIPNL
jgi:hypothetical protein